MTFPRPLAVLLPAALLLAGAHAAAAKTAPISYVTSSALYADAGSADGLEKGQVLRILRDGVEIATARITSLSSRRVALEAPAGVEVQVGDVISFTPRSVAVEASPASGMLPAGGPAPGRRSVATWLHDQGWRGRLGVRFYGLANGAGAGEYWEPALDLRADGHGIVRHEVSVTLDVRARRTFRTLVDGSTESVDRSRVYKAVAHWQGTDSPWRFSLGRQFSTALSSVSLFDGLAVERDADRWTAGVYAGTEPDYSNYGFSTDVRQQGVYTALHNRPGADTRWSAGLAFIGSYENRTINREHFALQGRLGRGRAFLTALQEVDLNRGWRGDHESALSFTNAFVSGRFSATETLSLNAGFDTRRNVRLYRDRITPETEFDDSYRRGYWGGASLSLPGASRVGLQVRRSAGGETDAATSATMSARTAVPGWRTADVGTRITSYTNGRTEGWLSSVSSGFQLGRAHAELSVGRRNENARLGSRASNDLTWGSLDVDARLSQAWYGILSVERNGGDQERNTQVYANALYRF